MTPFGTINLICSECRESNGSSSLRPYGEHDALLCMKCAFKVHNKARTIACMIEESNAKAGRPANPEMDELAAVIFYITIPTTPRES
jgi:hypothetical protein